MLLLLDIRCFCAAALQQSLIIEPRASACCVLSRSLCLFPPVPSQLKYAMGEVQRNKAAVAAAEAARDEARSERDSGDARLASVDALEAAAARARGAADAARVSAEKAADRSADLQVFVEVLLASCEGPPEEARRDGPLQLLPSLFFHSSLSRFRD